MAWVQATDSPVDTMNGFTEVYMDARGIKGAWEGIVYYINHEKTARIRALAENAQWFEDRMPIDAGLPQAGRAGRHGRRPSRWWWNRAMPARSRRSA